MSSPPGWGRPWPRPTTTSSTGWPPGSLSRSSHRCRPGDVPIPVPPRPCGAAGQATRAKGAPDQRRHRSADQSSSRTPRRAGGRRVAGPGVTRTATRATAAGPAGTAGRGAAQELASRGARRAGAPGVARPGRVHATARARAGRAVRVRARRPGGAAGPGRRAWLVVLTDRSDDDLGAGVLSHLVWYRLRTPDPWARYGTASPPPASIPRSREPRQPGCRHRPAGRGPAGRVAAGPGGVLTRDHAFGAVAAAHLGLTDPVVDAPACWPGPPTPRSPPGSPTCGRWPVTRSPMRCWTGRPDAPGAGQRDAPPASRWRSP